LWVLINALEGRWDHVAVAEIDEKVLECIVLIFESSRHPLQFDIGLKAEFVVSVASVLELTDSSLSPLSELALCFAVLEGPFGGSAVRIAGRCGDALAFTVLVSEWRHGEGWVGAAAPLGSG